MITVRKNIILLAVALALSFGGWSMAISSEATPIRIAFPSGMNGQVVIAMEKAGIAEKLGLRAEYSAFQYGPPMMEALASGSLDAVVTSLMPITSYAAKLPGDIRIVAAVGSSSHSLMVGKDSAIKAATDLAGKKIGVSFGSDSHLDLLVWLKENGLSKNASMINVSPSELVTALTNESVDAIVIRQPQVLKFMEQSGARAIKTWPFRFVSVVKTSFIADHPKEFQAYLSALREATYYVSQHHQQSAIWFGEYLKLDPRIVQEVSKDDPSYNARSLADIDLSVTPAFRDLIAKWTASAYEEKMIKQKVDIDKIFQ